MSEEALQFQVCSYIRMQYPEAIFHSDSAAGLHLTMGQAMKVRRAQSGRAWPDLFIAEPKGVIHGLFLELKKEGTRVWLKDGTLTKDAHIREQAALLEELSRRGYIAAFAVGFDQAKFLVDSYLKA